MKKIWLASILLIIAMFLIAVTWRNCSNEKYEIKTEPNVTLYLSKSDQKISMALEEYITGTVAAEMPASFEIEALKAQAVCARTYAINRLFYEKKYPLDADLSDDINCCQAYVSSEEFRKRHPSAPDKYLKKIREAVTATRGQVMLYQNEPLDALYCSTCGGKTENASESGGRNLPYLQGVDCPYCHASPRYMNKQTFSGVYIRQRLALNGKGLKVNILNVTRSGRIRQVKFNDKVLSGENMRSSLGLPSTWCSFQVEGDSLVIWSRGYGHGIGLCQFGANGMARAGYDYRQILHHYYQGFELHQLAY